jgi:hypothetical protein
MEDVYSVFGNEKFKYVHDFLHSIVSKNERALKSYTALENEEDQFPFLIQKSWSILNK